MKSVKRIFVTVLCLCMVFTAIPFTTTAATDKYAQSLREAGFPEDYIEDLCELHDLHPNWTFVADNITQLSRDYGTSKVYTWDYVIQRETDDTRAEPNNIIWETTTDTAYVVDFVKVESGHWYWASDAAVKFFMDPRNFLNEYDIFQFEKLGFNEGMTEAVVERILEGTFMYKTVIPDPGNTQTYASYIVEVARNLDLSAIQIASRLRMEQGVDGTNPLISGKCGDVIYQHYVNKTDNAPASGYTEAGLKSYNGYYNYFNMDAAGEGYFYIRLNGMKEAKENGWTTRKAAISGGAAKYRARYIEQFQYTPYYFKYNVHAGAAYRNFWGQYMQDVAGSWKDGRTMQKAYRADTKLDEARTFHIPVYEGRPTQVCTDPGNDYRIQETYRTCFDNPSIGVKNSSVKITDTANYNGTYTIDGWSLHTEGVYLFQYSVDGDYFRDIPMFSRDDVTAGNPDYTASSNVNAFRYDIPLSGFSAGYHNIVIRGVTSLGNRYHIADIDLTINEVYEDVAPAPDSSFIFDKTDSTVIGISAGTDVSEFIGALNKGAVFNKNGVQVTNGVLASGYKLYSYDGTGAVREEYTVIVENDVYGDGVVNSKDIIMSKLLNQSAKENGYTKAADADGDGKLSSAEIDGIASEIVKN